MVNFLLGDFLVRINNGQRACLTYVDVKYSFLTLQVLVFLYSEGYIVGFSILNSFKIRVFLKYYRNKPVYYFRLVSKPSRRMYISYRDLLRFDNYILSTSKGILSSSLACYFKVGGEILFKVENL